MTPEPNCSSHASLSSYFEVLCRLLTIIFCLDWIGNSCGTGKGINRRGIHAPLCKVTDLANCSLDKDYKISII